MEVVFIELERIFYGKIMFSKSKCFGFKLIGGKNVILKEMHLITKKPKLLYPEIRIVV